MKLLLKQFHKSSSKMANLTFWDEKCKDCGEDIDTYKDDYMIIEEKIICMECYNFKYEEDEGRKQSVKSFSLKDISVHPFDRT